jgi:hypothetical protein
MITEAGTKRPCSETELTAATGLDSWRIGGCLVRLDHLGLVRPLDQARERWEIAHDFLARLLGQLLGRLRPPLWRRVLPYTAPVLLVLWAVTLLLALPSWQEREYLLARRALADLGVDVTPADDRAGDMVKFPYRREDSSTKLPIGDDWLAAAIPKLNVIQPPVLDLSGTGVTDLGPLAGFSGLERLDLSSTGVTDLGPLAELSDLEWLDLSNTGVTDLGPLAKLSVLEDLFLRNFVLDDDVVLGGIGGS